MIQTVLRYTLLLLIGVVIIISFTPPLINVMSHQLGYTWFDTRRLMQLGLMSMSALAFCCFPTMWRAVLTLFAELPKKIIAAILAFFAIGVVSALLQAPQTMDSLAMNAHYFLWFLLVMIVAAFAKEDQGVDKRLLAYIVIACAVYALCYWAYLFVGTLYMNIPITESSLFVPHKRLLTFPNVRFFSQAQAWTMPLMVLPVLFSKRPLFKLLAIVLAVAWWMLLFVDASVGEMLSLVLAFLAMGLVFRQHVKRYLLWQLAFILVAYVLYYFLVLLPLHTGLGAQFHAAAPQRWHLITHAFKLIKQHPVLGVGPWEFSYYIGYEAPYIYYYGHPHNAWLLLTAEYGVVAGLLLLVIGFYSLVAFIKRFYGDKLASLDESRRIYTMAVFAAMFTGVSYSFFSGVLSMPLSQLLGSIIIGWLIGLHLRGQQVQRAAKSWWVIVAVIVVLIMLIIFWYAVAPMVPHLMAKEIDWMKLYHAPTFTPRFWQQGIMYNFPLYT